MGTVSVRCWKNGAGRRSPPNADGRPAIHDAWNGVVKRRSERCERRDERDDHATQNSMPSLGCSRRADCARRHAVPRAMATTSLRLRQCRRQRGPALRRRAKPRRGKSVHADRSTSKPNCDESRCIMAHSASATARPPSLQSCADCARRPPSIASSSASTSLPLRRRIARRRRADRQAVQVQAGIRCAPSSSVVLAEQHDRVTHLLKRRRASRARAYRAGPPCRSSASGGSRPAGSRCTARRCRR